MSTTDHHRWSLDAIPVPRDAVCPRCKYPLGGRTLPTRCPECGGAWTPLDFAHTRATPVPIHLTLLDWLLRLLPTFRSVAIVLLLLGTASIAVVFAWLVFKRFDQSP